MQAMHMMGLISLWSSVISVTVTNYFSREAGFIDTSEQPAEGLDDEEVEEEDWNKVTSNPYIQFKYFVNCDDDLLITARMIIDEICSVAVKEDKAAESEEVSEESPVPSFQEAVSVFEAGQRYMCSFSLDDASLAQLDQLERELLFVCWACPTKQTPVLDYFKK
jgi:hypothetical protein